MKNLCLTAFALILLLGDYQSTGGLSNGEKRTFGRRTSTFFFTLDPPDGHFAHFIPILGNDEGLVVSSGTPALTSLTFTCKS